MIHRFTNNMTVLYDGDAAGIKASIRGIDMLLEEGMNVKVCLLPDGDDPDSFARKHNATEFQAFIQENETDFIRFKTNLLLEDAGKDPIKRAELIGKYCSKSQQLCAREFPRRISRALFERSLDMELKPRRNRIQLAVLLLPGVLVFAMFTIYPIVKLLYMSFLEWNRDNMFEHSFAGLSNYAAVLSDATFRTAFANRPI